MYKFKWWKIPFLVIIAILAWVLIFPDQVKQASEIYLELKQLSDVKETEKQFLQKYETIEVESICDKALKEFQDMKVSPGIGCTLVGCSKKTPCCNSCWISTWRVTGTRYVIRNIPFLKCRVDGCGELVDCPKDGFPLKDLLQHCPEK